MGRSSDIRTRIAGASAALLLATSLAACGTTTRNAAPAPQQVAAAFAGSPPALAALHAQANEVLPATAAQFRARLSGLRGNPVILNIWGSWCGPCRAEFPIFQQAAVSLGRRVGFLGLDVADNAGDARTFLRSFPVTYPSYADPGAHTAFALHAGAFFPTTQFYDAAGKLAYTHAGPYRTVKQLVADVHSYVGA